MDRNLFNLDTNTNPGFGETAGQAQYMLSSQPNQQVKGSSTGPDWNTQWNNYWNQAWNAGYNSGSKPSNSSFQSAIDQGYTAGQNAYKSKQTGDSGGTGGSNPPSGGSNPPSADQQLLDNYFNSINDTLNNSENAVRQAQPGILGNINQNVDTSLMNLDRSNQAASAQINFSQNQGEQRKADALVAAQRLYNELMMGGQQRFGGASSAGEAYAALTGRELQRNNQQTQSDFQNFMGQIAVAKTNLDTQYQNALASLEQERRNALQQADRDFQDKLMQINSQRGQAAADKASAQLSALQTLRNNVFSINLAQAQNTQTLNNLKVQAEGQLKSAQDYFTKQQGNAQQGVQNYQQQTSVNPTSALSMGNPVYNNPTAFQGQINPTNKKDELFNSFMA